MVGRPQPSKNPASSLFHAGTAQSRAASHVGLLEAEDTLLHKGFSTLDLPRCFLQRRVNNLTQRYALHQSWAPVWFDHSR